MTEIIQKLYVTVGGSREPGKGGSGTYHPAHRMPGKEDLSSHVSFSAFLNRSRIINGEWKSDNQVINMIAWSSKTSDKAKAGDGFAEFCARHLAPGTSFMCTAELQYFKRGVKDSDGTFFVRKDGERAKELDTQWVIVPRSIDIKSIRFSPDQIIAEVAEYYRRKDAGIITDGMMGFDVRPPRWNSTDPRDEEGQKQVVAWNDVVKWRNSLKYCGGRSFGFFKVWAPEGATLLNVPVGATLDHAVGSAIQAPPSLAKRLGHTYDEYVAFGWTDAVMLSYKGDGTTTDPDFSIFIQSGELKTPIQAPPKMPTLQAPPVEEMSAGMSEASNMDEELPV